MSLTSVDLPGAGDAGDRDEAAERDVDVHVAQVVLPRPLDDGAVPLLGARRSSRTGIDLAPEVGAGERAGEP
jgi:hypothetical protein